jgi:hypothetical protein
MADDFAEMCNYRWDAHGRGFTCHCILLEDHNGPHLCPCGTAQRDGQADG